MSQGRTIVRVSATYDLLVRVGDLVQSGDPMQTVPDTDELVVAPVSGTVESVQFDSADHEFVIVIASQS
jgi:Na+-translocating ferredoxin:NAD+ oxidoreductase RnfC subunit